MALFLIFAHFLSVRTVGIITFENIVNAASKLKPSGKHDGHYGLSFVLQTFYKSSLHPITVYVASLR